MQRERYIDIVKGLAILCIVLLHYENGLFPTKVNVFVGSFMITTFYVTAGWLMAMRKNALTTKELLHRRWQQLGLPYCYWTAIIIIFDVLLWGGGYYDTYYIARELYKSVTLRGIGTLWFLPALFFENLFGIGYAKTNFVIWTILILMLTFTNAYHCIFDYPSRTFV
ncbi:MAG: acyltransferase family protein [Bacteroides cellulosilyticus]